MDYQLYYENADDILNESPNSRNSWDLASDNSMEQNDEYYGWNSMKIDEEKFDGEKLSSRKRKTSNGGQNQNKNKKGNCETIKDPLALEDHKAGSIKKIIVQNGPTRISQQWQVGDISDQNEDIDISLTSLDTSSYNNMNDAILAISGLTVFKQEAPSPTSQEINGLQITNRRKLQSPTSTQDIQRSRIEDNSSDQHMINNTINQLLNQTAYTNLQNSLDVSLVSSSSSQDVYNVSSSNFNSVEDSRFQYVLAAATSIATKVNEDTLTYLNQGQSYEIKLKKLGDLSMYRGKMLKSIIRICFHERRLQYMEKEQMTLWQKSRPGDRILDVDIPLSYGAFDLVQPQNALNIVHFTWDPTKEVGVYIKVNCISTEFTPKKHGGEKGVPFRIQVETYPTGETPEVSKRLHAAACQIKVFKLKGADRKHKQDREKIMKRPMSEQEKYQPSYECTVLNDIPSESVLSTPPIASIPSNESSSHQNTPQVVAKPTSSPLPTITADQPVSVIPQPSEIREPKVDDFSVSHQLSTESAPKETVVWLVANRFQKYVETFSSFAGADMLRLSRIDLIQICGQADGIRLFNALHSRAISPRLKLYVCKGNSKVFNVVFLSSYTQEELIKKLTFISGLSQNQIRDIYTEGPQSIHIRVSNEVIRHFKEETMFSLEIIQEIDSYIFLLKPTFK